MSKLNKLSGFPEWLPEQKIYEDDLIDRLRKVCQQHGFVPIETRSVEPISVLHAKGFDNKEILAVKRYLADDSQEAELALHFDLTVPFARYVAEHYSKLSFPFKKYHVQKSWRGERPQRGRLREFYQFDVDIIAQDQLPLSCDAECLTILDKMFRALALGAHTIRLNNRKVLKGFYRSLGLTEDRQSKAISIVDKIEKIGFDAVLNELSNSLELTKDIAERIMSLTHIRVTADDLVPALDQLNVNDELFLEGKRELIELVKGVSQSAREHIKIDLSLARGLDYYTGAIFEGFINDREAFRGLSCSGGGRYDDLCAQFINKKLPGVGFTFGLGRILDLVFGDDLIPTTKRTFSQVLVAVYSEDERVEANQIAERLRQSGVATEVYYKAPKLGKQIDYAANRLIPYVLFIQPETKVIEVKDLQTKEQKVIANLEEWAKTIL